MLVLRLYLTPTCLFFVMEPPCRASGCEASLFLTVISRRMVDLARKSLQPPRLALAWPSGPLPRHPLETPYGILLLRIPIADESSTNWSIVSPPNLSVIKFLFSPCAVLFSLEVTNTSNLL